MKKFPVLLFVLCSTALIACGKGQEINGHNLRTADRSVKFLKERLPPENRIEFEVAYWSIRDEYKNNDEFLDIVDGKTPMEIIALGKEIYQKRKDSGIQGYTEYASWGEMISKYVKDRMDQDNRRALKKDESKKRPNDTILYDLR
ncbi:MAG: hypothetical protein HOP23_10860 [Methylococcaceae bacterium]|nr:hypothetical protein [Methylococcaceae bacterium]